MKTFAFPYHRVSDEYPTSSTRMKFGGGYEFASRPNGPDQLIFKLAFEALWFFEAAPGVVDVEREVKRNMRALEIFYEEHRLYEKFIYPHPRRGNQVVRFHQPLVTPDGIPGGNGQVQPFSLQMILQP